MDGRGLLRRKLVSGTIASNTTWSPIGESVFITGDVTVNSGVTLTIEPGVEVRFVAHSDDQSGGEDANRSELYVYGEIIAEGTASDSIVFTSNSETPANKATKDLGYSYPMIRNKYMQYRNEILEILNQDFEKLSDEIESDVRQLADGGKRKGPRDRGSRGKVKVFGILERQGKIFTTAVDIVSAETLMNEVKKPRRERKCFLYRYIQIL